MAIHNWFELRVLAQSFLWVYREMFAAAKQPFTCLAMIEVVDVFNIMVSMRSIHFQVFLPLHHEYEMHFQLSLVYTFI